MSIILSNNPSMDGNQEHQAPSAPTSSTTSSNGGPTPNSQTKKSPNHEQEEHQSPSNNSSMDDNQEHQPPSFPSSSTTSGNRGPPPNSQTKKAPNPINAMLDDHKPGESDINTSQDSKASTLDTFHIERAMTQGRGRKALNLTNSLIVAQPWNGELHRLKAQIYAAIAAKSSDSKVKKLNLVLAIACARDAVILSIKKYNSLCYLASLLLEVADDAKGYQQALEQCQRALEINEYGHENSTTEAETLLKRCQDERIKFFWTCLPRKEQWSLLRVSKSALQDHFKFLELLAADIIAEALAYGQRHGTWRFFLCSLCGERLPTSDILFEHWTNVHIPRLPLQVQILLCSGTWRPNDCVPSADSYSSTTNMPSDDKTRSIALDEQLKERVGIEGEYLCLFLGVPPVEAGEVVSQTSVPSTSTKLWGVLDPINAIKHILAVGPTTEHLESWNSLTNKILSEGSQLQQTLEALTTDVQLEAKEDLPMKVKEALENLDLTFCSCCRSSRMMFVSCQPQRNARPWCSQKILSVQWTTGRYYLHS